MLDGSQYLFNSGDQAATDVGMPFTPLLILETPRKQNFSDVLRDYMNNCQSMDTLTRHNKEAQLIKAALKLQMKAAKSDLMFRMVNSFNENSVHVTVTWKILNHNQCMFSGQR